MTNASPVSRMQLPITGRKVKYAVAVILHDSKQPDKFLVVTRPGDDVDHAGSLGFPATSLRPGELVEDVAKRICREKLGCEGIPTRLLGVMYQERNSYDLFLMDVDVVLVGDKQPDVNAAHTSQTAYVDQKWTADPMELMPSAQNGSCCSSIFLSDRGLLDREEWIRSLKGSTRVG